MIKVCNRIVEYSFYALFLLVPLAFTSATSELFEFNKMWLTWALTIIIGMSWLIKMTLQRKFFIQRTPLDIPIVLFLFSQIISTIFSLDFHTSLWGYYSRFNGGLLSIISYIFLYYAFLSNFQTNTVVMVKRSLFLSLISGLIVALWGLPSHFGYDPTCLLFRGTFDVSCWTAEFLPKVRIFSTLGQPDWLAAYLAILIPITIAFAIQKTQNTQKSGNSDNQSIRQSESLAYRVFRVFRNKQILYMLLTALFYVDLLYTRARSGFLAIWISLAFLLLTYAWIETKNKKSFIVYVLLFGFLGTWIAALVQRKNLKSLIINPLSFIIGIFLLITFAIGTPISQLHIFTLEGISSQIQKIQTPKATSKPAPTPTPAQSFESGGPASPRGGGGTESGDIRLLVWEGAISAWRANPIFGTGVETFAFAYYKYKPANQNLTSEWNFLYNKAHNEYLNYLATTGIVGLGTYLFMIGYFFMIVILRLKAEGSQILRSAQNDIFVLALLAAYVSILITNFFGFSVVMTNVYLFMIPAFVFALTKPESQTSQTNKAAGIESGITVWQWTPIFFILIIGVFMLFSLVRAWQADVVFALGYNLDRAGEYQQAYPNLHKAVQLRGDEPVFKDELSLNDAVIAAGLVSQKPRAAGIASGDARQDEKTAEKTISVASSLAQEAINTSNEVISQHPNNAVFWKTRVRIFHTLSQVDSRYLPRALDAIEKVSLLAPNDANIWYNLGVLYGQNSNIEKGISALEKTIMLKPDYRDAHYGLGLFYHQKAIDKNNNVIDSALQEKAIAQMQYVLEHINLKDADALSSLENWAK